MDNFYGTVSNICFVLLGLWFAGLQVRGRDWVRDQNQRNQAHSVFLSFLVPGIMSLGAQFGGEVRIVWRMMFVVTALLGATAAIFFIRNSPNAKGWFMRIGRLVVVVFYLLIALVAIAPQLTAPIFGADIKSVQVEAGMIVALIFLGVCQAWEFAIRPVDDPMP